MAEKMPDFLDSVNEQESLNDDSLDRLKAMAESYFLLSDDIAEIEKKLEAKKELFKTLTQEEIPDLLAQKGLSEIKLDTGEKIKVTNDLSVSIPEEKQGDFFAFLKKRNEEDIIKMQVHFDRMKSEKLQKLISFLNSEHYDYDSKRDVHPQTKKKYFKELLGLHVDADDRAHGIKEKRYLRPQDIEDFASVFQFRKTKIKK